MSIIQSGISTSGSANVNEAFAIHVRDPGGPNPFFLDGVSGTVAAAVNGDLFAMRLDPSAPAPAHISKVICWYRCIAAFTVPLTPRFMRIRRFAGTVAAGGTAITAAGQHDPAGATSEVNSANGGDARIATTLALTSPGTPDTLEIGERINLVKFGLIHDTYTWVWDYERSPVLLAAGMSMALGTSAAFDAGGTFELGVHVKYFEGRRQG